MDTEYLPLETSLSDVSLQTLNLIVACVTLAACAYVVPAMFWWWIKLHHTLTIFRPFILAVGLAKAAVAFWSATGIVQIEWYSMTQPLITLPARVAMMVAALTMAAVVARYCFRQHRDWQKEQR